MGFADGGNGSVAAVRVQHTGSDDARCEIPAQLVLIAKGFTGPESGVIEAFADFDNVHLAGDARLASTLLATAIADALEVAENVARDLLK